MSSTLKDIAQSTGFSINTVSRALRDDKNISVQTKAKICEKAKDLNYIPNAIASSLRSASSKTLGVISADSFNPFFSEVIGGIENSASQYGYHILIGSTDEILKKEVSLVNMFYSRKIDGLLVIPVYDNSEEHLKLYQNLSIPYIFLGRYIKGLEHHSVLHNDVVGQKNVFDYLLDKGHKKILYIAGPKKVSNTFDRIEGLRQSYAVHDIALDDKYIVHAYGHIEDGYAVMNQALNRGLDFTAIVCFNDMMAMGALKSLSENDLKVPKDVELVGYDNLYMSQFMQPSLTTVDVPKFSLGFNATERLIRHIEEPTLEYKTIELPTRMVFRETTR
ncbi:MAG: LacI family transcriptional regulator [Spirochaetales bacterium]|nr:LacI family transcriptional regulator [Spirochaetales bacterium]